MFKGKSAWACMLVIVLLLGMLVPVGAGAQSAKPTTVRIGINAYLDANGGWEVESEDAEDALFDNFDWILNDFPGKEVVYKWSLCDTTLEELGNLFSLVPTQAKYKTHQSSSEEKAALTKNIGKDLLKCEFWCEGSCRATAFYYIQKCIDMPTMEGNPLFTEYVYFEEGKELTIQITTPLKINSGSIWYCWFKEEEDGVFRIVKGKTSENFYTFTPTADDHGKRIGWSASQSGVEYWNFLQPEYILQSKTINPIIMPNLTSNYTTIRLAGGKSETLRLPPARTEDSSKTLEYRWYRYKVYGDTELVQAGSEPALMIQNSGKDEDQGYMEYTCKVGYKGDENSFLDYNHVFYVTFYKEPVNPPTDPDTIFVPSVANPNPYYFLKKNESVKLSVPAASGDSSKKLNYNWFASKNGEYFDHVASTDTPELQVTHTGKESGKVYYICDVGYSDDYTYESYVEYNVTFTVEFAGGSTPTKPTDPTTPTSAPKTGDNTPLTALFLLLGISLAGATVLAGKRRGHEHS